MKNKLSLNKLKKTAFSEMYHRFMINNDFTAIEKVKILAVAVYLISLENDLLKKLGYRIIVEYCNRSNNYYPLYELAVNNGLYPISKFIEEHYAIDNNRNFFTEWNDCFTEQYKSGDIYLTEDQSNLKTFFQENSDNSIVVVAPTSYGKSELIIEAVGKYSQKRICIITTTKALLIQTTQRIRQSKILDKKRKIIIHPEMYNTNDKNCIAVLTQERLLRLLKKNESIAFDCIIIDEAHELLEENTRSNILASVIIVSKKRNPNVLFKFLTPFVADPNNLQTRYTTYNLETFKVTEYIKTEKFYFYDMRNDYKSYLYDQFFDDFYITKSKLNNNMLEEEVITQLAGKKNIIYLNKPTDIEKFALDLADLLPNIIDKELDAAFYNISQYMQPQYNLLYCLSKGVVYHHGSVPDIIRTYIEKLYKTLPSIKYVVTSSTLMSGINLPAEKIFILDGKKGNGNLKPDAFRNLIGRVCRFSEIFNYESGDLHMLEPEIHIIFGSYFSKNANGKNFLKKVAKIEPFISDTVENVLLTNTKLVFKNESQFKEAQEFLENYEHGIIKDYKYRYTQTHIGKACVSNAIREIDVFDKEIKMQSIADIFMTKGKIANEDSLLEAIDKIFISNLTSNSRNSIKLTRLEKNETKAFYSMFLKWRTTNKSYSEMIMLFVRYWERLLESNKDTIIFVGRWGDRNAFGSHNMPYTSLYDKDRKKLINLAIVRKKEEQDFIDNNIIRFVEVLNDLKMLNEKFYKQIKYGTSDDEIICMIKNGLSYSLSKLLKDRYRQYTNIDIYENTVEYSSNLIATMIANKENNILIHEIENNI